MEQRVIRIRTSGASKNPMIIKLARFGLRSALGLLALSLSTIAHAAMSISAVECQTLLLAHLENTRSQFLPWATLPGELEARPSAVLLARVPLSSTVMVPLARLGVPDDIAIEVPNEFAVVMTFHHRRSARGEPRPDRGLTLASQPYPISATRCWAAPCTSACSLCPGPSAAWRSALPRTHWRSMRNLTPRAPRDFYF